VHGVSRVGTTDHCSATRAHLCLLKDALAVVEVGVGALGRLLAVGLVAHLQHLAQQLDRRLWVAAAHGQRLLVCLAGGARHNGVDT
jgi:hypothetical protein